MQQPNSDCSSLASNILFPLIFFSKKNPVHSPNPFASECIKKNLRGSARSA